VKCLLLTVMLGKTILLCTADRGATRTLTGHLRGAGNEVLAAADGAAACDLVAARAVDLVLVDSAEPAAGRLIDAASGRAPVVVLSAGGDAAILLDLVCDRGVEHVLARDGGGLDDLAREVVVTAEKILRGDLFGIEKYLPGFGVELATAEVTNATDRDRLVETIGDHAEWLGAGREARRAIAAIVDELVTNAIYDAPRDAAGRPRYLSVDRRTKIQLAPWEHVLVRWGSDGEVLALSVTDWFGALRPEHVRSALRRCLTEGDQIEQKAGGAGIGLYTALAHAGQLVVNIDRGERTEIIAIVDLRRRAAGARRAGRSLHLFFDDSRARAGEVADASPISVQVSESMLVELREKLAPQKRRSEVVPLVRPKRSPTVRARGTTAPPSGEPVGAGTACGLLHGATRADTAIEIALRFLTHHFDAAIAYTLEDGVLAAATAAGHVRDWAGLCELRLLEDDRASVTALAARGASAMFAPSRPVDHKLAMLASGDSEAAGVVVPLFVGGELRWILYGARQRDAELTPAMVEQVRHELERCLARVDPELPEIELRMG